MSARVAAPPIAEDVSYEGDFRAWALRQATLLCEGKFGELDVENLAEEIESLGRSQRSELVNRLIILLTHLLKWQFQPERRGRSWSLTIATQRDEIGLLQHRNPSLRPYRREALHDAYDIAVRRAAHESGLPERVLPDACPYTIEQVLDVDFWPDRRHRTAHGDAEE